MRIGHISDFHLGKPSYDEITARRALEWWLEEFERREVDLVVVSGDLVETPGDEARLRQCRSMFESSGHDVVVVPGNHDVPEPGQPGPFEEHFGVFPRVVTQSGVQLLLFDSMRGIPVEHRSPDDCAEQQINGAYSKGRIGVEQVAAIDERLASFDQAPVRLLVVHHHLRTNAPTPVGREEDPTAPRGLMAPLEDAEALLDWATDRGVRVIFHGHKHNYWEPYEPRPGLTVLNTGTATRGKASRRRHARLVC